MKKVIDHLRKPLCFYFVGVGLLFTSAHVINQYAPLTLWFEYQSLEPVKQANVIGEDLYMVSVGHVKRPFEVTWTNKLYCDMGDYYARYSMTTIKSIRLPKPEGRSIWKYEGKLPTEPMICYLTSEGDIHLKYGVARYIEKVSGPFYFHY